MWYERRVLWPFLDYFFFRAEIPLIRFLCFLCSGVSKIIRYFFFIGIVHGLIFSLIIRECLSVRCTNDSRRGFDNSGDSSRYFEY